MTEKVVLFHVDTALRACLTAVALLGGLFAAGLDCTVAAGSATMATVGEWGEIGRGDVSIC